MNEDTKTASQSTVENVVRCKVLLPHCREINGQMCMLEPMFSGIVTLPNNKDTRRCIEAEYLELVPNAEGQPRREAT